MGLLLSHKRTCRIRVDAISFFVPGGGNPNGGGKRGEINGFSAASRKRMIQLLHSVKFQTVSMITLTYGKEFPECIKTSKMHLKEWRRRFEKSWGTLRCIWRLELQKRGAPHYHILILDCPYIQVEDIQNLWYSVTKVPDTLRFGNAVDMVTVRGDGSRSRVIAYISKYLAKAYIPDVGDKSIKLGRVWGYWNIEEEPAIECELDDYEARVVSDTVRSMWSKNYYTPDDPTRCTLFGEELGTGEFMTTVKGVIERVTASHRGRFGKVITFDTVNITV
jgi:hypothetical protein